MAATCSFEDLNGAISWARLEKVLNPQLNEHGCRKIVFDVVQRLKSRRYETVLNTFTLLHTYSINAGPTLCDVLASDLLFTVFMDIQKGKSNTLAAGLAQLLYDWKHMFGNEGLGKKFNPIYEAVLPRAAPQIRPSPQAVQYLLDPPVGVETFRKPLVRGFDHSLFDQKHRPAVFSAPGAHVGTGVSTEASTGSSMAAQPRAPMARAATEPSPAPATAVPSHLDHPHLSVNSDPNHTPSPAVIPAQADERYPAPESPPEKPAAVAPAPTATPSPAPHPAGMLIHQPTPPLEITQHKPPRPLTSHRMGTEAPPNAAMMKRNGDNRSFTGSTGSQPTAPLDTAMPDPETRAFARSESSAAQSSRTYTRNVSSNTRTTSSFMVERELTTQTDDAVAGDSVYHFEERMAADFPSGPSPLAKQSPEGSPLRALPRLPTVPSGSIDMRSATMSHIRQASSDAEDTYRYVKSDIIATSSAAGLESDGSAAQGVSNSTSQGDGFEDSNHAAPVSATEHLGSQKVEENVFTPMHSSLAHTTGITDGPAAELRRLCSQPEGAATKSFNDNTSRHVIMSGNLSSLGSGEAPGIDAVDQIEEQDQEPDKLGALPEESTAIESSDDAGASQPEVDHARPSVDQGAIHDLAAALTAHSKLMGHFCKQLAEARASGDTSREQVFQELGGIQAQTCKLQQRLVQRAQVVLEHEGDDMSQLMKASSVCSSELLQWEQIGRTAESHDGASQVSEAKTGTGTVEDVGNVPIPDRLGPILLASPSVSTASRVARQPSLRTYDVSYILKLANATSGSFQ